MTLIMKSSVFIIALVAIVWCGTLATAAPGDVKNSVHNFAKGGVSAVMTAANEEQVCIFCHTPHNAGSSNLLWNKATKGTTTFRFYTSSKTLTATARAAAFTADSPSLLCLSCHDGKTAMNVLHSVSSGASASGDGYPAGTKYLDVTGANIMPELGTYDFFSGTYGPSNNLGSAADGSNATQGDDLTNDHPVGFSYTAAQGQSAGRLNAIGTLDPAIRFFGASNNLECSSCHNPHSAFWKPFLVMNNDGSALCLSCHNK